MKKFLLFVTATLLCFVSCESYKYDPELEILFKAGEDIKYKYSDFELYDSSTHILYFKTAHPELKLKKSLGFSFLANGDEIYHGVFLAAYSSYLPSGPFIFSYPSIYPDFVLKVECWLNVNNNDLRNDPRIIASLADHDLLHSGLSVIINSVEKNGSQLTFSYTVTNNDQSDLLILDQDKLGINLYHYFTNGLSIRDLKDNTVVFESKIEYQKPSPWNGWKPEWLSEISSGESKTFVINYPLVSPLNPGEYSASFEFPGLHYQISKDQLIQKDGRIWLGEVRATKSITIQ